MGNNTLLAGTAPDGTSNLQWHHGAGVLMLGIGWLVIAARSRPELARAMDGLEENYEAEFRVMDTQGRWRWLMSRGTVAKRDAQGRPIANRVEPGKRPRSSMAPTLVFDKASGRLLMSGGSPGGALIIHYTAKTLHGVLNWGLTPQQAINLPNFGSTNGPSLLEEKKFPPATVEALRTRGAEVREMNMTSGLQAITRANVHGKPMWLGGADPRREGVVLGD